MNIKKLKKIVFIISFIIIIFFINISTSQASSILEIFDFGDNFVHEGSQESPVSQDSIKKISNSLYNTLLVLGTVIAVIIGAILGIQFITGSVEQKSKVKESLIPYFVGCAVIFGAFGIWKLVMTMLGSLT